MTRRVFVLLAVVALASALQFQATNQRARQPGGNTECTADNCATDTCGIKSCQFGFCYVNATTNVGQWCLTPLGAVGNCRQGFCVRDVLRNTETRAVPTGSWVYLQPSWLPGVPTVQQTVFNPAALTWPYTSIVNTPIVFSVVALGPAVTADIWVGAQVIANFVFQGSTSTCTTTPSSVSPLVTPLPLWSLSSCCTADNLCCTSSNNCYQLNLNTVQTFVVDQSAIIGVYGQNQQGNENLNSRYIQTPGTLFGR